MFVLTCAWNRFWSLSLNFLFTVNVIHQMTVYATFSSRFFWLAVYIWKAKSGGQIRCRLRVEPLHQVGRISNASSLEKRTHGDRQVILLIRRCRKKVFPILSPFEIQKDRSRSPLVICLWAHTDVWFKTFRSPSGLGECSQQTMEY